ncbi:phosphotransferase [Nonomuraea polychroma]|uniref:phosphotransferase n=1 Tax=Nonomuraea polychroma TaxID=46176 RepID=UPI003D908926
MTVLPALSRIPAGLTARRAWPHADGLAVEATTDEGTVVGLVVTDDQVRTLTPADPALPALGPALAEPGSVLLGHRPGRRAVLREAGGHYRKIVRPDRSHKVADGLRQARERLRGVTGAPQVPIVLAAEPGWVRLAALPGPSLNVLLANAPDDAVAFCARVSVALAALLRAPVHDLTRHTASDEVAVLRRWTADADAACAIGLSAATEPVAAALLALPTPQWAVCHRDLHDKQLIAIASRPDGGSAVGLLDLDTLAAADPALDAGNLLAHLHLRTLRGHCAPDVATRCARALIGGELGAALEPTALRIHTAAALLRLAGVYTFRPGQRDLPTRLAALATDVLSSSRRNA